MPVGLDAPANLEPVPGIRLGVSAAGIRRRGGDDIAVIECQPGSTAAAVFTQNAFCAAPVIVAREHLECAPVRYLLVNAGNANAGTGAAGLADARATCEQLAGVAGVEAAAVLPFSTGVIGERLPVERVGRGVEAAFANLGPDRWIAAARAIMTTDTLPKGCSEKVEIDGRTVTVTGIAKGSGMIRPDMATMLAFVATDAAIGATALKAMLRRATGKSFNRITVDGDTSTNDACVAIATGAAGNPSIVDEQSPGHEAVASAIESVCATLAQAIVRDGEGATKFVTVRVTGARDSDEALEVAYTVAHSPLVKTALFASDPNWGRILAAVGRAGISDLDVSTVSIAINGVTVASGGGLAAGYTEAEGVAAMAQPEIELHVELGRGPAAETVWTSDLSHEYVRINAEYRT